MEHYENSFGERLKKERLRLGLTQEELATIAGMKPLAILNYEKNKSSPALKTLYAFEKEGMNLPYLVLGDTWMPKINNLSKDTIQIVGETLQKLNLLYKEDGGLSETARINATLLLLEKVQDMITNDKKPEYSSLLLHLLTKGIGH